MDTKYWTTERLNRLYKDWPSTRLDELKQTIKQSHWRLGYHIQTETGLLNDPNGFSYFNNEYHLFFQAFPFGAVHGLKSWVHMASDDMVHWHNVHEPMVPDNQDDRHGCYSGSALPVGDRLFLMYTGNVWEGNGEIRAPRQVGAWMDKDNKIQKLDHPLIANPPEGVTGHFRDPQVIHHGDYYYAFLGAQTTEKRGEIVVYRSEHIDRDWQYYDVLDIGNKNLGYMAECPNVLNVDGHIVVIFCPQGMDKDRLDYDNVYPNTYIVADDLNWETMKLVNPSKIRQLDEGFDFYAAQGLQKGDDAYITGWIGLPDTTYPSDDQGWEGALTMVRKLSVDENGILHQQPIKAISSLFETPENTFNGIEVSPQSLVEWKVDPEVDSQIAITSGDSHLVFDITDDAQKLTLHRQNTEGHDETRSFRMTKNQIESCHLYIDNTTFELFVNDGGHTMTGWFFHSFEPLNLNWNDVEDVQITPLKSLNINNEFGAEK